MLRFDKRESGAALQKVKPFSGGMLKFIVITVLLASIFSAGIIYGVQGLAAAEVSEGSLVGGVKEFKIRATQWNYAPAILKMNPGDTVRFLVTSGDMTHGFAINELGLNLALSPGREVPWEVTIPPDIAEGTYTMYCSVFCGIGHPYMKGSIIVGTPVPFWGVGIEKILPWTATGVLWGLFAAFIISGRRE